MPRRTTCSGRANNNASKTSLLHCFAPGVLSVQAQHTVRKGREEKKYPIPFSTFLYCSQGKIRPPIHHHYIGLTENLNKTPQDQATNVTATMEYVFHSKNGQFHLKQPIRGLQGIELTFHQGFYDQQDPLNCGSATRTTAVEKWTYVLHQGLVSHPKCKSKPP